MRIMISSNGIHTTSGYGTQAKQLAKLLQSMGHEVAAHAWYGLSGGCAILDGILCYPYLGHPFGGDTAVAAKHFEADLVITLQDLWVLPEDYGESLPCAWAAWVPVDGEPLSPDTKSRLAQCAYPIAMSEFGQRVMAEAGISSTYIPHGLDPIFQPPADRAALREMVGVPEDAFVVLMVAANKGYPSRKAYPEALDAFSKFHQQVDSSILYLHTIMQPGSSKGGELGLDIFELIKLTGIPETAVKYTNQWQMLLGIDVSFVAQLYGVADVLLNPSTGEGFGLPVLEAQACGTPVITQACSAMTELTFYGVATEPGQRVYNPLDHWHHTPKVSRLVDALHQVHAGQHTWPGGGEKASQWAHRYHDWDRLAPSWAALLDRVAADTGLPAVAENGRLLEVLHGGA